MKLKVLIACEESQTVCKAFRALGHEAYSCDVQEPSGGHPGWHIQDDAIKAIHSRDWDLLIAFPPCTYLSYVGLRHWNNPGRAELREDAFKFFMAMINAPVEKICVENPLGYPSAAYRPPTQVIHPYYFGDPFQKRTCLWLKNLPKLEYYRTIIKKPEPLYICQGEKSKGKAIHWVEGIKGMSKEARQKARSVTFPGIANNMAMQWGDPTWQPAQASLF